MNTIFKLSNRMLEDVRTDLVRPHRFAHERVGFLMCRAAGLPDNGLLVLAAEYEPIEDDDYLQDRRVGAMMGPTAIRKALQRAYNGGDQNLSLFHIHMHNHKGRPGFSHVDLTESSKFVPDFFNAAPTMPHGVLVLSRDSAAGLCWRAKDGTSDPIDTIVSVGTPTKWWRA